jgi:hypothetical protein
LLHNEQKLEKLQQVGFLGFKLHLIVNDRGEIVSFQLTSGNIAEVSMLKVLTKDICGQLYGDKGYILSGLIATQRQETFY